jgi:hypothetical protein
MSLSAEHALQKAIHARLMADATLVTIMGTPRIHDEAPQRTAFPYVTSASSTLRDYSTGTEAGHEHLVTLNVWSRAAGRKEAHAIMLAIRNALHDATLTLEDHRLVNLRHELSEVRREEDGDTIRGTLRLRAVTEPTS